MCVCLYSCTKINSKQSLFPPPNNTMRALRRSPMALAVPLDGTESIAGLRHLEAASIKNHQKIPPAQQRQYKGKSILFITMDDVQQPPKPWRAFFGGPDPHHQRHAPSYTIPRTIAFLLDRAEANVVHYLPNYLRLLVAALILQLYLHPKALAAACVLCMTALVHASTIHSSTLHTYTQHIMPVLYVAGAIIAQRGRCVTVIVRWLVTGCGAVGVHAACRVGTWEQRWNVPDLHWTALFVELGWVLRQRAWAAWVDGVVGVRTWWRWGRGQWGRGRWGRGRWGQWRID